MRILYILNTLAIGGAERLVISLAERMAARGHEVRIVTLLERVPEQWSTRVSVTHLDIGKSPLSAARGFARALGIVRRFRPHVVNSHNYQGNLFARGLKAAWPALRVVSTLHNEYEGGRARMLSLRLTDSLTWRTIAVSEAVAERALQLKVVPKAKCGVISNGIDLTEFEPDIARRARMRAANSAGEDFIWLTAGRLTPAKDYPSLLRAFAQVHPTAPDSQLWIAGDGDPDYTETLRVRADLSDAAAEVVWLGMRRDMAALLDAADGFVLSSAWEGMPLALAEAMAMEKPIVATGVGGVGELTYNCGLVVPPRNPDALARAMLSIMHTPPEAREFLGRAARQRVLEKFNIEDKALQWERVYEECGGTD
ncbi:MAG TPA: glycosyltransferase [Terracidiphilus sp.]|jgi:glycosyltransferase involved in cell wall biosynthesis